MMGSRYEGRPLLRLLELLVLDAIGALSPEEQQKASALTPHLARTYNRAGTWVEILMAELELPSNLPDLIREKWERNQEIARTNRVVLTAQAFAEMFVDTNLTGTPRS